MSARYAFGIEQTAEPRTRGEALQIGGAGSVFDRAAKSVMAFEAVAASAAFREEAA